LNAFLWFFYAYLTELRASRISFFIYSFFRSVFLFFLDLSGRLQTKRISIFFTLVSTLQHNATSLEAPSPSLATMRTFAAVLVIATLFAGAAVVTDARSLYEVRVRARPAALHTPATSFCLPTCSVKGFGSQSSNLCARVEAATRQTDLRDAAPYLVGRLTHHTAFGVCAWSLSAIRVSCFFTSPPPRRCSRLLLLYKSKSPP
jgi:hypothetical protein